MENDRFAKQLALLFHPDKLVMFKSDTPKFNEARAKIGLTNLSDYTDEQLVSILTQVTSILMKFRDGSYVPHNRTTTTSRTQTAPAPKTARPTEGKMTCKEARAARRAERELRREAAEARARQARKEKECLEKMWRAGRSSRKEK